MRESLETHLRKPWKIWAKSKTKTLPLRAKYLLTFSVFYLWGISASRAPQRGRDVDWKVVRQGLIFGSVWTDLWSRLRGFTLASMEYQFMICCTIATTALISVNHYRCGVTRIAQHARPTQVSTYHSLSVFAAGLIWCGFAYHVYSLMVPSSWCFFASRKGY